MVSIADAVVMIKIPGGATFHSSLDFKTLIQELRNRGHERFLLDLRDCLVMDSTFLGVLAGLGQRLTAAPGAGEHSRMKLMCPSPRVSDLLENLGVTHLFNMVNGFPTVPQSFEAVAPAAGQPSKEEISRTCLEAHLTLMDLNPANIPKFKDVTRFLAEDLEKGKAGQK